MGAKFQRASWWCQHFSHVQREQTLIAPHLTVRAHLLFLRSFRCLIYSQYELERIGVHIKSMHSSVRRAQGQYNWYLSPFAGALLQGSHVFAKWWHLYFWCLCSWRQHLCGLWQSLPFLQTLPVLGFQRPRLEDVCPSKQRIKRVSIIPQCAHRSIIQDALLAVPGQITFFRWGFFFLYKASIHRHAHIFL